MVKIRARGEAVRRFILENVEEHAGDIVALTAVHFDISRQAVGKHLTKLTSEGALRASGRTRGRTYTLAPLVEWSKRYDLTPGLPEDQVWRQDVAPVVGNMADNVRDIWSYAFTEIFNNAVDHSEGSSIWVKVDRTAVSTRILVLDDGVGIFEKIQHALDLPDPRQAVLELAKGKFTTDPDRHTGEGIFFTSRMVDDFSITSKGVHFSHEIGREEDWILGRGSGEGTAVFMTVNNHTARSRPKVFDEYKSSDDDYGFTKTVVPVSLVEYGDDNLISRSQAKRLLARFDKFRTVILEFEGVESIGQAFADEIFRVFPKEHPDVRIVPLEMNDAVLSMVARALGQEPDVLRRVIQSD